MDENPYRAPQAKPEHPVVRPWLHALRSWAWVMATSGVGLVLFWTNDVAGNARIRAIAWALIVVGAVPGGLKLIGAWLRRGAVPSATMARMGEDDQRKKDAKSLRTLLIAGAVVITFPIWGSLLFLLFNVWFSNV